MEWIKTGGYHSRRRTLREQEGTFFFKVINKLKNTIYIPLSNLGLPREYVYEQLNDGLSNPIGSRTTKKNMALSVLSIQIIKLCILIVLVVEFIIPYWFSMSSSIPDFIAYDSLKAIDRIDNSLELLSPYQNIIIVSDPQLTDENSSTPNMNGYLTPLINLMSDIYMKRISKLIERPSSSYDVSKDNVEKHTGVIFLGDLFDGGRYIPVGDSDEKGSQIIDYFSSRLDPTGRWKKEMKRFWNIFGNLIPFKKRNNVENFNKDDASSNNEFFNNPGWFKSVVGNHDVDLDKINKEVYDRFTKSFGKSNWYLQASTNVTIVGINSVSLVNLDLTDLQIIISRLTHKTNYLNRFKLEKDLTDPENKDIVEYVVSDIIDEKLKIEKIIDGFDDIQKETIEFLLFPQWNPNTAIILVSHEPLYREKGAKCDPMYHMTTFRSYAEYIPQNTQGKDTFLFKKDHTYKPSILKKRLDDESEETEESEKIEDFNAGNLRFNKENFADEDGIPVVKQNPKSNKGSIGKISKPQLGLSYTEDTRYISWKAFSTTVYEPKIYRKSNDIHAGVGKGYQNTLTEQVSDFVVDLIGNPRFIMESRTDFDKNNFNVRYIENSLFLRFGNAVPLTQSKINKVGGNILFILSGDDHDYCNYYHESYGVNEFTLPTFSFLQGTRQPGYARVFIGSGSYLATIIVSKSYDWFWWIFNIYCTLGIIIIFRFFPIFIKPLIWVEVLYAKIFNKVLETIGIKKSSTTYRIVMIPRFIMIGFLTKVLGSKSKTESGSPIKDRRVSSIPIHSPEHESSGIPSSSTLNPSMMYRRTMGSPYASSIPGISERNGISINSGPVNSSVTVPLFVNTNVPNASSSSSLSPSSSLASPYTKPGSELEQAGLVVRLYVFTKTILIAGIIWLIVLVFQLFII